MKKPSLHNRTAFVTALCWVLWIIGGSFLIFAVWLAAALPAESRWVGAAAAALAGTAAILAGAGLYQMRRWGVILFGALAVLGSINHLSGVIQRFPDLASAGPALASGAIISVLGGFLIPFGLIYFTLLLWRQTR